MREGQRERAAERERERQSEIEYQRMTVTTVTDKESDREQEQQRERERGLRKWSENRDRGGRGINKTSGSIYAEIHHVCSKYSLLPAKLWKSLESKKQTGRETERDTQRQRRNVLLPFICCDCTPVYLGFLLAILAIAQTS